MKLAKRYSGFTLLEVMVAVAITAVVLAGVVTTFSNVTKSTRNAARASDLTNSSRGLAHLLEYDFASAGKGLGDINALNIHYKFTHPDDGGIVNEPVPDTTLYGVTDLTVDGDGFSEVVLQWFDYDLAGVAANKNPTFIVDFSAIQLGLTPIEDYDGTAYLISNKAEHLDEVKVGDIFLFYKNTVFADSEKFETDAIWNAGIVDDLGSPANGAVILQVESVGTAEDDVTSLGGGEYFDRVAVTFSNSRIFDRTLGASLANPTLFTTYAMEMSTEIKDEMRLPEATYLARKLGDGDSFHRVHYRVEGSGATRALVRDHNGQEEVVATGVNEFLVSIGVDVPEKDPDAVVRDDMDGFVTSMSSSSWVTQLSDMGSLSAEQFKRLVGRHAIGAQVYFSQQSLAGDTGDSDSDHKERSFVQQFRILNNSLPVANL